MIEYQLIDAADSREKYIELFKRYCEELLKEDPTISQYDYAELAIENLDKECDRPCFISVSEEIAGFVVFMDETESTGDNDCHTYIGELFILPEYRKRGIAGKVVCDYIDSLEYDTGFCYIRNSYAGNLWIRLLNQKGYRYDIFKEDEVRDFVHIHLRH